MTSKQIRLLSFILGLGALVNIIAQIVAFRPIQDDYFILRAVSEQSIISLIQSVWSSQGGNIVPYAVNALLLESGVNSLAFISSRIFLLLTLLVVILTAYSFAKWLGFRDRYLTVAYVSISVLSFEGIFSPLQIAAYSWHQTSITHLWPIALTFLSWAVSGRTGIHHVLLVCLGFVVGNSNSAEAVWAFLATIAFIKTFLAGKQESTQMKRLSLNFFLLGNFVGILLTVAAPGFWNRANNSVGFPESLTDFVLRFAKSASAFGFDILTHPYLYLTLILGVLSRNLVNENSLLALRKIKWFLIAVSILLYSLLVLGTTLGYPAWHQSLGLFVVLTPTFFVLGLSSIPEKSRSEIQAYKVFMYSILILCLFLTARTSVLEINRSARWDLAFHSNLCSISRGETKDLIGADLVYPIFRKGVEDIETWKWMKESYIGWLTNEYLPNSSACKD